MNRRGSVRLFQNLTLAVFQGPIKSFVQNFIGWGGEKFKPLAEIHGIEIEGKNKGRRVLEMNRQA